MTAGLALLLQAAAPTVPATPATVDGRAVDATELFMSRCVVRMGSVALAHELDADPAHARAMSADELSGAGASSPQAVGWIVHGDNGGWAALTFEPARRACMVTVRAADASATKLLLRQSIDQFYRTLLRVKKLVERPTEISTVDGVRCETLGWDITLPRGQHFAVLATLGDQPIGARQHLLSFFILH